MYCIKCGNELNNDAKFCSFCGQRVEQEKNEELFVQFSQTSVDEELKEEQAFLDETYRYLRWEKKAWDIFGNVFLILGIIVFVLLLIVGLVAAIEGLAIVLPIMLIYALIYGTLLLVPGIVAKKAAIRINFYLESMYVNFETTRARCESVGMIVFCVLFCQISLIFYVINFARMKGGKKIIDRINKRLGNQ